MHRPSFTTPWFEDLIETLKSRHSFLQKACMHVEINCRLGIHNKPSSGPVGFGPGPSLACTLPTEWGDPAVSSDSKSATLGCIDRVPSFYYQLKTFFNQLMQIRQLFTTLKQPVHISVTVFYNLTKFY